MSILLPFPSGCVVGRLIRREKRFFVHVLIDGKPAVPVSIGACLGILFLGKILAANIMRVIQMGGKINLKKSA